MLLGSLQTHLLLTTLHATWFQACELPGLLLTDLQTHLPAHCLRPVSSLVCCREACKHTSCSQPPALWATWFLPFPGLLIPRYLVCCRQACKHTSPLLKLTASRCELPGLLPIGLQTHLLLTTSSPVSHLVSAFSRPANTRQAHCLKPVSYLVCCRQACKHTAPLLKPTASSL